MQNAVWELIILFVSVDDSTLYPLSQHLLNFSCLFPPYHHNRVHPCMYIMHVVCNYYKIDGLHSYMTFPI